MLRIVGTVLLIFISYLLQTSVFSMLPFIQTTPNLLLVLTFSVGILRGKEEGLIVGVLSGLFLDLMSGGYIGFYGLIYMYIGLMCGMLYQHIDIDIPLVPIVLCIITQLLYHLYVFVFRFLLRGRLGIGTYLKSIIMPELVLTTVIGIFLYGIIMLLNDALEDYEKRSALKFV
jgi:rod shape-determining protein MreD